jgi:hypothetical protein
MLQDNPLVVGSPYPLLPIWSTVTLKFIEARDDRSLNRRPGAKLNPPAIPHIVADYLSSTHHLGTFSAQSLGRPRLIIAID